MGRFEYYAPAVEVIEAFARDVCSILAQRFDAGYAAHEVARGLASFIKVVADIRVKQLNERESEQVDRRIE